MPLAAAPPRFENLGYPLKSGITRNGVAGTTCCPGREATGGFRNLYRFALLWLRHLDNELSSPPNHLYHQVPIA